jgi:hypothetical protein
MIGEHPQKIKVDFPIRKYGHKNMQSRNKSKNFTKFSKPDIYLGVMLSKKNRGKFTITRILENDTFISMCIHKM